MTDDTPRKPGLLELLYSGTPTKPARPFHQRPEWKRLSAEKRRSDPYCEVEGCREPAAHADHRLSVAMRPELALDMGNLMSLCKGHHSQKTAAGDGGYGNPRKGGEFTFKPLKLSGACDERGRPLDPNHPWNREPNRGR